jgi:Bacteriophage Sf6, terminase small subunit-like
VRADFTFGEQIITIADDAREDWIPAKNGGAPRINKEVVLRSRLRIAARQLHMARLHPQTWGDRQKLDIKSDWSLLTEHERRRRAEELIDMLRELREPPPGAPPLVYRWEEAPEEAEPGGIGWKPRSITSRKGG